MSLGQTAGRRTSSPQADCRSADRSRPDERKDRPPALRCPIRRTGWPGLLGGRDNRLHAADLSVLQPDLDAVRMRRRIG